MKLYINTLGDFDMIFGEESLLKKSSRAYKLYKLFQYFLTYRNKKLLPEVIIDSICQDNESCDPKNMLRTQIFRLRQIIKQVLPKDLDEARYLNINFVNGYYCLEIGDLAILDIDEFEHLIQEGNNNQPHHIDQAIWNYKKALKLYKGAYLSENPYETWIVPTRNYLNRLYVKTLFKLIEILKEKECYEEIIELCEEAIVIEPYEETIHIYLIGAMLKLGQANNAMSHYEFIVSMLDKEMGVKPSPGLKDAFRKIQSHFIEKGETDIINIKKKLEEESTNGALFCDFEYFKFLFNIQKRKALRNDESDFMGLITFNDQENTKHDIKELKKWSKLMTKILKDSLRQGDAFTFWNDTQILIMLHDVKTNGLSVIENRIIKNLKLDPKTNTDIKIKFQPIISDSNIEKAL